MNKYAVLVTAVLLNACGCSQAPALKQPPIVVSGKVSQGGQPVGNIVVSFHPLDQGHVGAFPVKPDGSFQGELIPGSYSYYVGKSAIPNAEAALRKVDPKYYEPNLERTIAVNPNEELILALD